VRRAANKDIREEGCGRGKAGDEKPGWGEGLSPSSAPSTGGRTSLSVWTPPARGGSKMGPRSMSQRCGAVGLPGQSRVEPPRQQRLCAKKWREASGLGLDLLGLTVWVSTINSTRPERREKRRSLHWRPRRERQELPRWLCVLPVRRNNLVTSPGAALASYYWMCVHAVSVATACHRSLLGRGGQRLHPLSCSRDTTEKTTRGQLCTQFAIGCQFASHGWSVGSQTRSVGRGMFPFPHSYIDTWATIAHPSNRSRQVRVRGKAWMSAESGEAAQGSRPGEAAAKE